METLTASKGRAAPEQSASGRLIVNADDWGRSREITDKTVDCVLAGAVSSVSAMVFMEDSERAAALARDNGVDAGLHLNFTAPFTGSGVPTRLQEQQQRLMRYLRMHRLAPLMFHPGLIGTFADVFAAQWTEYTRIYGGEPARIDGHHHMHLCSNVLLARGLPVGTQVRRSFSFQRGEKGELNRLYRRAVDRMLQRRYHLTDYFFSLPPLQPAERLQRIFGLARQSVVEVETHPVNAEEYKFLTSGDIFHWTDDVPVARGFFVR